LHAACASETLAHHVNGENSPASTPAAQQVQVALLRLPAKQRAAIVLTIYDGLNHAEAARILGCSETTVSWRVFAARRKLKHWLNHEAAS
jgi:RNA polymerase sigma-70 factor (ECF subfamily)